MYVHLILWISVAFAGSGQHRSLETIPSRDTIARVRPIKTLTESEIAQLVERVAEHNDPRARKELLDGGHAVHKLISEKVSALMTEVASDSFSVRERARKKLHSLGDLALPALEGFLKNEDAEVRRTARDLSAIPSIVYASDIVLLRLREWLEGDEIREKLRTLQDRLEALDSIWREGEVSEFRTLFLKERDQLRLGAWKDPDQRQKDIDTARDRMFTAAIPHLKRAGIDAKLISGKLKLNNEYSLSILDFGGLQLTSDAYQPTIDMREFLGTPAVSDNGRKVEAYADNGKLIRPGVKVRFTPHISWIPGESQSSDREIRYYIQGNSVDDKSIGITTTNDTLGVAHWVSENALGFNWGDLDAAVARTRTIIQGKSANQ